MRRFTKTQIITTISLIAYGIYEFYFIPKWNKTNIGAPIRVDLFLFYPILSVFTLLSLYQAWKRKTYNTGISIAILFLATVALSIYLVTRPIA